MESNTINHVSLVDATTHNIFCRSQGNTVVNPETFFKVTKSEGTYFFTILTENRDDVCQIVFPLSVVSVDVFKCFEETFIIKNVSPCIDFFNLLFEFVGIFLLNNLSHFAIFVTDNTTITKRIVRSCSQDSGNIFVINMEINKVFKAFTGNQRRVTGDNKRLPFKSSQLFFSHHYCVTSPQLLSLHSEGRLTVQNLTNKLSLVTNNSNVFSWFDS